MTDIDLRAELEQALGIKWAEYKALFPQTASRIERRCRSMQNVLAEMVTTLERDAVYQEILAATNDAMAANKLVLAIADAAIRLLPVILAAF